MDGIWAGNYKKFILAMAVLLLIGCGERELLGGLGEKQSMEIMVRLSRAGIQSDQELSSTGRERQFRILVDSSDYLRALEVLHEYGLPRNQEESIEALTRSKGFLPDSPEMAAMRRDHALGLEVERLLEALPGVVEAKVVIRSVQRFGFLGQEKDSGSTASVVIRYSARGGSVPFSVDDVKQIVSRTAPGLTAERVNITTTPVLLSPELMGIQEEGSGQGNLTVLTRLWPFQFQVPRTDKERAQRQLSWVLAVFVVCGCIFGFYLRKLEAHRSRRDVAGGLEGTSSLLLESGAGEDRRGGNQESPGKLPGV